MIRFCLGDATLSRRRQHTRYAYVFIALSRRRRPVSATPTHVLCTCFYSHSTVAGGLPVTSYITRSILSENFAYISPAISERVLSSKSLPGTAGHEVTRDNGTDGDAVFCSVCGNREQNGKCLTYLLCRKFCRDYSVKLTQQIG